VTIPRTFTISSQSTAAAQFEVSKGGKNYMGVYAVETKQNTYTGLAKEDMAAGEVYTIKLAGIQNPRYQVIYSELIKDQDKTKAEDQLWQIRTYDTTGFSDANNLIDAGKGGHVDVTVVTPMSSFGVDALNQTNGVATKYFVSWFSNVKTVRTDKFFVEFARETVLTVPPGAKVSNPPTLTCLGVNGFEKYGLTCQME